MWLLPAVCLGLFAPAAAAVEVGAETESPAPRRETRDEQSERPDREHQKRVVRAAGYVLLVILGLGAALIGLVVLWGRRMRRMARKPARRQSAPDQLWYLRPKKVPPAADTKQQDQDPP